MRPLVLSLRLIAPNIRLLVLAFRLPAPARVIITIKLELDALREHFLKVSALRRCWLQKEGEKKGGKVCNGPTGGP
jgi:hypothetical protein